MVFKRIKKITINKKVVIIRAIEKIKGNRLTDVIIRMMEKKLER